MKYLLAIFAVCAIAFSAVAADDTNFKVSITNAAAGVTNATSSIDLGTATPSAVYSYAYMRAAIPAMPNCTNAATTMLYTLQTSTNNSTWVYTDPIVQVRVVGVASTGTAATTQKMPIPPDVKRYLRVEGVSPAASGANTGVTNVFTLVVP